MTPDTPNPSEIVVWLRSGLLPAHSETVKRLLNMSADLIEQLQRKLKNYEPIALYNGKNIETYARELAAANARIAATQDVHDDTTVLLNQNAATIAAQVARIEEANKIFRAIMHAPGAVALIEFVGGRAHYQSEILASEWLSTPPAGSKEGEPTGEQRE